MKKILLTLFIAIAPAALFGGERQNQPDFFNTSTQAVMSLAINQWTLLEISTWSPNPRVAVILDHLPNNTQDVLIAITSGTLQPGATNHGMTMKPDNTPWVLSYDRKVNLWGIAIGQPQTILYQEAN